MKKAFPFRVILGQNMYFYVPTYFYFNKNSEKILLENTEHILKLNWTKCNKKYITVVIKCAYEHFLLDLFIRRSQ